MVPLSDCSYFDMLCYRDCYEILLVVLIVMSKPSVPGFNANNSYLIKRDLLWSTHETIIASL